MLGESASDSMVSVYSPETVRVHKRLDQVHLPGKLRGAMFSGWYSIVQNESVQKVSQHRTISGIYEQLCDKVWKARTLKV
jgi:hypothetical protein